MNLSFFIGCNHEIRRNKNPNFVQSVAGFRMRKHDEWLLDYDRGRNKVKHQSQIVADDANKLLCICVDFRKGTIRRDTKPVFIMELYAAEAELPVIKFFNCKSKSKGAYKVLHDGDFAKMYRLTLGEVDKKRFSRAQQLLGHFLGCRFVVSKYEPAISKDGTPYLKATEIKPETPFLSAMWWPSGVLKKATKRRKSGDEMVKNKRQKGDEMVKNRRQKGDDKTLQAANSLYLEPVLNPTKTLNTNTHNTTTHYKVSVVNDIDTAEYF